MGFSDIFSDFYNSIGFTELHAEAPPEEETEDDEGSEDKGEEKSDDGDKEEGGEEEPEDPKPKLEAGKSMALSPYLQYIFQADPRATVSRAFLLDSFPHKWQDLTPVSSSMIPAHSLISEQQTKVDNFSFTECAKSAQCASLKHHYDQCAERVTQQQENPDHKGPKEDCVEECEFGCAYGSY